MENIFLKYKSIFLLLIGLISANCSKESTKEICISGYVFSTNNETPVAGALVRITGYEGSYLGSTSTYVVDEATTDSEGKYSFKYKERSKYSYRVSTSHPKYFYDQRQSEIVLSSSVKQNAKLFLIPEAWVKLYAKRVSNGIRCLYEDAQLEIIDTSNIEKFIVKYKTQSGSGNLRYSVRFIDNVGQYYNQYYEKSITIPQFDTIIVKLEW
jgi:hypothetical protein